VRHGPSTFAPIEIGLSRRDAPGVGLRRRRETSCGRRRPAVGRRPSGRLKSALPSAMRQRRPSPAQRTFFGRRRPTVGRRPQEAEFIRRTPRQASAPPTQRTFFGRRRPTVGRRPQEAEFIRRTPRQASAFADAGNVFGRRRPTIGRRPQEAEFIRRAPRQALAFAGAENVFRSAQAGRWPKAFSPIEIGLLRRLRAGRRPSPTQRTFFGRRRPTVGRRPQEAEFIRHAGRSRSNSFDPHPLTIASPHPPSPPIPEPYRRCRRCPRAAPRPSPGLRSLPDAPAGGGGA
jgi:hypothetical protein